MNGNPMQIIMQMMAGGGNPQRIVQQMMKNNPQASALMNQVKQSGMTTEQYARQYAKQNNIDIDSMLKSFQNRGR